jgi:hypothetical protein
MIHLANCNEHPNANDRSLSCWAIRHDDGRRVTPDEAMDEINRLRMLCAWTPVTDRLPENGKPVLVACGAEILRAIHIQAGWFGCNILYCSLETEPTHWMHLPDGPHENKSE